MRRVRLEVWKRSAVKGGRGRLVALVTMLLAAGCSDAPLDPKPAGDPAAVAWVEITPDTVRLQVGATRTLGAAPRALDGRILAGKVVAWASSDQSIARVDEAGNLTALREGTVWVTARSGGKQGEARIEVSAPPPPAPVAWLRLTGGNVDVDPGRTVQLVAAAYAAGGTQLYDRAVTWSSSDSTVVRVDQNGKATGLRGGTATITAVSEGRSAETTLRVPEWLRFDLSMVDGIDAPATLSLERDTIQRTELATVIRERRVRLAEGRVWFSTVDARYRQLFRLETWEREITISGGNTIAGQDRQVADRTIRDEGAAREYDVFTLLYSSITFPSHSFSVMVAPAGRRMIQQPIPGEAMAALRLVFSR